MPIDRDVDGVMAKMVAAGVQELLPHYAGADADQVAARIFNAMNRVCDIEMRKLERRLRNARIPQQSRT